MVLSALLFPPFGKFEFRRVAGCRIEADDGRAIHDLFGDEIFIGRHLHGLIGNLVGKMGRDDDDALIVADQNNAGENRNIADRPVFPPDAALPPLFASASTSMPVTT